MTFFNRTALLLGALMLCSSAVAAPEGHYRGEFNGEPASADLELMGNTLIGILVIGDDHYLIDAKREGNAYHGVANAVNGEQKPALRITEDGSRIRIELAGGSGAERLLELTVSY